MMTCWMSGIYIMLGAWSPRQTPLVFADFGGDLTTTGLDRVD